MREFESTRYGLGTPRYPYRVETPSQPTSVGSQISSVDLLNTPNRFSNTPSANVGTSANATATVTPSPRQKRQKPGLEPESLTYILEEVFGLEKDSILEQALKERAHTCYLDIIGLDEMLIETLMYPRDLGPDKDGNKTEPVMSAVPEKLKNLLHGFKGYIHYCKYTLETPITIYNCMEIFEDDFHAYRGSTEFMEYRNKQASPNPLVNNSQHQTPLAMFKRGIKIDASSYPTHKDDRFFDHYNRQLHALAALHGTEQVLDPNYKPLGKEATELFTYLKNFMYSAFVSTLLTDTGKKLVRQHEATKDGQAVYAGFASTCKEFCPG